MSIALCKRSCLKRSYQTNYWHRQTTARWLSATLNTLSLIQDELRKIDRRIGTARNPRETKQLEERRNQWKRFEQCIGRRIRRLRRIQWKQILLNQFILIKIDHTQRHHFDFDYVNRQLQSLFMAKQQSNIVHNETHRISNATKLKRLPKLIKRRKDEL